MIISPYEQNSPEWELERLGLPTGSCFKKIMNNKFEPSEQRQKYLETLAIEKFTGEQVKGYQAPQYERGHEREEESALRYQMLTGTPLKAVGLCYKDELKQYGASPDRLAGEDGGFESKDAAPHVQLERLDKGWKGTEHRLQCLGCMLVTGRKWWDLQSYSRGIKRVVIRFERYEEQMRKMEAMVEEFVYDLGVFVRKYRG